MASGASSLPAGLFDIRWLLYLSAGIRKNVLQTGRLSGSAGLVKYGLGIQYEEKTGILTKGKYPERIPEIEALSDARRK